MVRTFLARVSVFHRRVGVRRVFEGALLDLGSDAVENGEIHSFFDICRRSGRVSGNGKRREDELHGTDGQRLVGCAYDDQFSAWFQAADRFGDRVRACRGSQDDGDSPKTS